MLRQTITISGPNHDWFQSRVESGEFRIQTEAVNDALCRVREMGSGVEATRAKLICAEQRGFTGDTPERILTEAMDAMRKNSDL